MFTPDDLPTLHAMQDAAARVRAMIYRRAVIEYHAAFGAVAPRNATLDGCVLHNSLVGLAGGAPWREVNYQHMRKAKWLLEKSYEPSRIVTRWYDRKCRSREEV